MLKIVFLDAKNVGQIANFKIIEKLGQLEIFGTTPPDKVIERSLGKDVIITSKVVINKNIIDQLPELRLICVAATGTNNIDVKYAGKKGIQIKNVAGYSTESVAQLTFSMLLYLVNRPYFFDEFVKSGAYTNSNVFTYLGKPFWELHHKQIGIIGLGTIGRRVAQIAHVLGMDVVFYSTSGLNNNTNYKRFDLDTLLSTSDVVSIHAPLNEHTKGLINYEKLKIMRPCSILLNTGRGGIIVEDDLARALSEGLIGGAGLDVFENEPINADNPLLKITDKDKLLLSPHVGWTSVEARQRLIDKIAKNIEDFRKHLEETGDH